MSIFVPIEDIIVEPGRMRPIDDENVAAIADSIMATCLFTPLVVERRPDGKYTLRAGEHRREALRFLFATGEKPKFIHAEIPPGRAPVLFFENLTPAHRLQIEYDENIKRKQPTWAEQAAFAARMDEVYKENMRSIADLAQTETAVAVAMKNMGMAASTPEARTLVELGKAIRDNPELAKAKTLKEAAKIETRKRVAAEDAARATTLQTTPESQWRVINSSFLDWREVFPSLVGSATLLLTDPPYGIGIEAQSHQSSVSHEYDDSYESWKALMAELCVAADSILRPDAHGYIFCDFNNFFPLRNIVLHSISNAEVYPRPMVWNKSPDGRMTIAEKWPKRSYECILYFRRGNLSLNKVADDVLTHSIEKDAENYHAARKPVALMADLISRSTRPGDLVVDLCCGSGPTLRAAKDLTRRAVGFERDPSYAALATRLLEN